MRYITERQVSELIAAMHRKASRRPWYSVLWTRPITVCGCHISVFVPSLMLLWA